MKLKSLAGSPDPTLAEIFEEVRTCLKQEATSQHRIGTIYNNMVDRRLAERNGLRDAQHAFAVYFPRLKKSTLMLYSNVARKFPEDIATKYGMTNLDKLITFLKKSSRSLDGADPGPFLIPIPQQSGPDVQKAFADCTRDEIALAIAKVVTTKDKKQVPAEDATVVNKVHDAVLNVLGTDTTATVKATTNKAGQTLVSIENVSVADLPTLFAALAQLHPEAPSASGSEPVPGAGMMQPISPISTPPSTDQVQPVWGLVPVR